MAVEYCTIVVAVVQLFWLGWHNRALLINVLDIVIDSSGVDPNNIIIISKISMMFSIDLVICLNSHY